MTTAQKKLWGGKKELALGILLSVKEARLLFF